MTIKEALKYFDSDILKAYELAICALEKQNPRKWIMKEDCNGDALWLCPECNYVFMPEEGTPKEHDYNFCPACGQALK